LCLAQFYLYAVCGYLGFDMSVRADVWGFWAPVSTPTDISQQEAQNLEYSH
jgi:hypothetical protein